MQVFTRDSRVDFNEHLPSICVTAWLFRNLMSSWPRRVYRRYEAVLSGVVCDAQLKALILMSVIAVSTFWCGCYTLPCAVQQSSKISIFMAIVAEDIFNILLQISPYDRRSGA